MLPFRRFAGFFVVLLISGLFLGAIVTASFFIQEVFAFSDSEVKNSDTAAVDYLYVTDLPYLPVYDTTFPPKHVTVTIINKKVRFITYGLTVKDALFDLGIGVDESQVVNPDITTFVIDGMTIQVNKRTIKRKFETEKIPFDSASYVDNTIKMDTSTIVQIGTEGEKKVLYEYEYLNGILTTKTRLKEILVSPPQNEITAIGNMRVFSPMTIGNDSFNYWKVLNVFATSYDKNCLGCNEWTATGKFLEKGICAVDPKVIPLHSHFYVPGYGFCAAEDVGGAVKGNRIDLGFYDFANHPGEWSARYVDIYLID